MAVYGVKRRDSVQPRAVQIRSDNHQEVVDFIGPEHYFGMRAGGQVVIRANGKWGQLNTAGQGWWLVREGEKLEVLEPEEFKEHFTLA